MKLKQATQLAIIGVIIQLISLIIYTLTITLAQMGISLFELWRQFIIVILIIGTALLLPFFVTLFKSQK